MAVGSMHKVIISIITTITINNKIVLLPKMPKEQAKVSCFLLVLCSFGLSFKNAINPASGLPLLDQKHHSHMSQSADAVRNNSANSTVFLNAGNLALYWLGLRQLRYHLPPAIQCCTEPTAACFLNWLRASRNPRPGAPEAQRVTSSGSNLHCSQTWWWFLRQCGLRWPRGFVLMSLLMTRARELSEEV